MTQFDKVDKKLDTVVKGINDLKTEVRVTNQKNCDDHEVFNGRIEKVETKIKIPITSNTFISSLLGQTPVHKLINIVFMLVVIVGVFLGIKFI